MTPTWIHHLDSTTIWENMWGGTVFLSHHGLSQIQVKWYLFFLWGEISFDDADFHFEVSENPVCFGVLYDKHHAIKEASTCNCNPHGVL